jgi:hypothetical protein
MAGASRGGREHQEAGDEQARGSYAPPTVTDLGRLSTLFKGSGGLCTDSAGSLCTVGDLDS